MKTNHSANTVKKFDYLGYLFLSDGTVYTPKGKKATICKDNEGYSWVTIRAKSKNKKTSVRKICIAKALYEFYHPNEIIERSQSIGFYDGNKNNYDPQNMFLISKPKSTNIMRSKKSRKKALTMEQVKEIQNIYKNSDKHFRSQWNKDSYSIRDLAKKYGVSNYTIQRALAEKSKTEERKDE